MESAWGDSWGAAVGSTTVINGIPADVALSVPSLSLDVSAVDAEVDASIDGLNLSVETATGTELKISIDELELKACPST